MFFHKIIFSHHDYDTGLGVFSTEERILKNSFSTNKDQISFFGRLVAFKVAFFVFWNKILPRNPCKVPTIDRISTGDVTFCTVGRDCQEGSGDFPLQPRGEDRPAGDREQGRDGGLAQGRHLAGQGAVRGAGGRRVPLCPLVQSHSQHVAEVRRQVGSHHSQYHRTQSSVLESISEVWGYRTNSSV